MIPILFEAGYISVQSLWVFTVAAMLASSYLAVKRLKRKRVEFTLFIQHSTAFFISGLILSRLVYFGMHTDTYFPGFDLRTLINFLSIWDQGFSLWGFLFGFFMMMTFHIKKAKQPFWRWMDALTVPVLVAMMIGMIGAFLGGYAYGTPTDLPWGIQYESFNVRYTVPVHPTQVYFILFIGGLLWMKNKLKEKTSFFDQDGNTSIFFGTFFFLGSFLLEFIRGSDTLLILGYRLPHYLYGIGFLISLVYLIRRLIKPKQTENEPV